MIDYVNSLVKKAAIDVLKDARKRVEQGWCQGKYQDGDEFCASGAIRYAAFVKEVSFEVRAMAMSEFRAQIRQTTNGLYSNIPEWNDVPVRTKEQVLGMFDECVQAMELSVV